MWIGHCHLCMEIRFQKTDILSPAVTVPPSFWKTVQSFENFQNRYIITCSNSSSVLLENWSKFWKLFKTNILSPAVTVPPSFWKTVPSFENFQNRYIITCSNSSSVLLENCSKFWKLFKTDILSPAVTVPPSFWKTVPSFENFSKFTFLNSSSSVTWVEGLPRFPLISTWINSSYNRDTFIISSFLIRLI